MPTTDDKPPPPGSDEAVRLGCRCAVLDNRYGRGAWIDRDGKPAWWVNGDCPLHGWRDKGSGEGGT